MQLRRELAFSLYPEGLRYSPETRYFETHECALMNSLQEMIEALVAGKNIGAGDGI